MKNSQPNDIIHPDARKLIGSDRKIRSVAILGGGPVASTLATLLARDGIQVAIFHRSRQSPLLVGESLVPAIIPILRSLGVEEEVRAYGLYKPGATINLTKEINFSFPFSNIRGPLPGYAYNVPRDKFDDTLLNAARKAGTKITESPAAVETVSGTDRVQLARETLALWNQHFPGEPDFIVDATGRIRLLPNALKIPSREGGRKDTALFAHVDQTKLDYEGHVHTTRLDYGWSWRIPLQGRVSVGMVISTEHLPKYGTTKEERYDNLLRHDSVLRQVAGNAKRITPVMEYTNYQLVSDRVVGDGWALVGDTAGFIDPVFSSGLLIGMQGAVELAKAIRKGTARAFEHYQKETIHHLKCWHEIVDYFYSGSLFNSVVVGNQMVEKYFIFRLMMPHMSNHFGKIFTGAASNSRYSLGLLRFVVNHGLSKREPKDLMIR